MQEGWVVDVVQFGYREWGSEYLPLRTDRLHLAAKVPFCLSEGSVLSVRGGKYIPSGSEESVDKGSRGSEFKGTLKIPNGNLSGFQ